MNQRPHYPRIGIGTFQLQLFATGPVLARYAYKDVIFGQTPLDNGASATIGVVGPTEFAEYSFNTASVSDNDYIDVLERDDTDEYRFSAVAGRRLDVAYDAFDNTNIGTAIVQLLDENNVCPGYGHKSPD